MMSYYPFMGFWTGLVWLIDIIVIAYLIYKLIKARKSLRLKKKHPLKCGDILDEQYAKGELTKSNMRRLKRT
jgi:uncharacterized membrane protein